MPPSAQPGLRPSDIDRLRAEHGWNELPAAKRSLLLLFLRQFQNVLVYILLAALAISIALRVLEGETSGESWVEAGVILAILILNALLGFLQEYKAEEAIAALQELTSPTARVRRDGAERMIPSRELLPGDIVILDTGDRISADGDLILASHLEANEASLTGESLPVEKEVGGKTDGTLAEQRGRVFAGTLVTRGSGEMRVTAIGVRTEIGKVAQLVSETKLPETPLDRRMKKLSHTIGLAVLALCAVIVSIGLTRDMGLIAILLLAVSLAVSAVPEGLPAVVTASLALGVRGMARKNALVRRLDSLETLGSVTVICSDKTGTITENRMKVREKWLMDAPNEEDARKETFLLLQIAASCNRAQLPDLGDPTEIGLLEEAHREQVDRLPIEEEEVPFTSEAKYMRTRHGLRSFLKGAPEVIAGLCGLGQTEQARMAEAMHGMTAQGLRVLACAVAEEGVDTPRLVGLLGLLDPPRVGVKEAIEEAHMAGIRTIMITGDSLDTAIAIAKQVGIEGEAVAGADLEGKRTEELQRILRTAAVFARVTPQHKIQLLSALKAQGDVVAMTGDGVNDAPALKGAHVGIAMGKVGTQVAKEAASIVLADDSFATIVLAIREGRRIYDNIRKFVLYLLRANFGELCYITTTIILGLPVPYLPIHILWINLMTDGLPALALATEPADPNVMRRPPRAPGESLFAGEWRRFLLYILAAFLVPFSVYAWHLQQGVGQDTARTMSFTTQIVFELLLAFTTRSAFPLWQVGFLRNKWLLGAVAVPLLLHLLLLYTPLSGAFHLVPITLRQWWVVLCATGAAFLFLELLKPLHVGRLFDRGTKKRGEAERGSQG